MKGRRIILDAISAMGAEELDLKSGRIHVCVCTANKCIEGLPGISFVFLRKGELERIQAFPQRSLYLDLKNYWKEQETGGVPFTPAVQIFYALDQAVKELIKEGVSRRIQRYASYAKQLRKGFGELGLENFLSSQLHSNTLTALKLPKGLSYEKLHDELKKEGFVIYAGQGPLSRQIFRVANMGQLSAKIIRRFLKVLENVLKKYKI
jgi:2-aminoethylphosphonate-pyruvate transaminase